jgi:hypothetical protein
VSLAFRYIVPKGQCACASCSHRKPKKEEEEEEMSALLLLLAGGAGPECEQESAKQIDKRSQHRTSST